MNRYKWGPWLPILTALTGTLATIYILSPQMSWRGNEDNCTLWMVSWITTIIWGVIAVLSGYQLFYQILATLAPAPFPFELHPSNEASTVSDVSFIVLYLTCDDFVYECCLNCLDQEYKGRWRFVICDDSREPDLIAGINEFQRLYPKVEIIRRETRGHFKAGNINHAFRQTGGDCDWIVVVDADQALPQDYLARLAEIVVQLPQDVAFLQAGRLPLDKEYACPLSQEPTLFQKNMQLETLLFYERSLDWRSCLGFSPFLGHGGAIRSSEWSDFPHRVSEDIAWTLDALTRGKYGVYVHSLRSWEAYPQDYSAFLTRVSKFASGAAELLVNDLWRLFAPSQIKATDRLDALFWFLGYALLPIGLINLFFSAFVAYEVGVTGAPLLAPILPYLFLGMCVVSLAAAVSVIPSFDEPTRIWSSLGEAIRYWFWSFAVYSAAWPTVAWSFTRALIKAPVFHRTPKLQEQLHAWNLSTFSGFAVGAAGMITAMVYRTYYSWILIGFSSSMLLSPLFTQLHLKESSYSRAMIYVPGILFLLGLVLMWLDT